MTGISTISCLVFMLCCMGRDTVVHGFFTTTLSWPNDLTSNVTIDDDGVYLVNLLAYPAKNATDSRYFLYLTKNGQDTTLLSAAREGVAASLDAVLTLKVGDVLAVNHYYGPPTTGTAFSVTFLSEAGYHFLLQTWHYLHVLMNTKLPTGDKIPFCARYTPRGWSIVGQPCTVTSVTVQKSGVYWVSARPVPSVGIASTTYVVIGDTTLTMYGKRGVSVSCSGAYYLTGGSQIYMRAKRSNSKRASYKRDIYRPDTTLTVAILEGNARPNTGSYDHLAWTGKTNKDKDYATNETVLFQTALTNKGNMYNSTSGIITIPVDGAYLISLRPFPSSDSSSLRMIVHLNIDVFLFEGTVAWPIFSTLADRGVPSGMTSPFLFQEGDRLHVTLSSAGRVNAETMMSVAFVSE